MNHHYTALLKQLFHHSSAEQLTHFGLGIEREALRITADGQLAQTPHPASLGKALTHSAITTDFAENLLEFITPVSHSVETLLSQLGDLHKHTLDALPEQGGERERLWPLSMPCYVDNEEQVPLAQYGSSNIGQMKTLYRKGLKLRYGSMMQVIAGVHFNFSFPTALWQALHQYQQAKTPLTEFISEGYLGVMRNYFRNGWIIPYLFGASPALSASFFQRSNTRLPFQSIGRSSQYLPYATALRLSDLGYTNKAQSELKISYNSPQEYIDGLRSAIKMPSAEYAALGLKQQGEYQQLNTNMLQIENELYSSIRPKTVANSGEKPSEALSRGVEYIEIRALDLNPFSPLGVEADQLYFIQLLLLDALLVESPPLNDVQMQRSKTNFNRVILQGRKPGLMLQTDAGEQPMVQLAQTLFDRLAPLAMLLDQIKGGEHFSASLALQRQRVADPGLTLSGRILARLQQADADNCFFGQCLAKQHSKWLSEYEFQHWNKAWFDTERELSETKQHAIEAADNVSFEQYLADYFNY